MKIHHKEKKLLLKKFTALILLSTTIFCSLPSIFTAQADITIGKALSPWDRTSGVTDSTRKEQYQADMEEIEAYYEDCAEQTDIEGVRCINIHYNHYGNRRCTADTCGRAFTIFAHCADMPEDFPYREYWMPFQKGEQVQVPFTTAFVHQAEVAQQLKETEKILYGAAPDLMKGDGESIGPIERLNKAAQQHQWPIELEDDKIKEATEDAVKELTQFDPLKYRFRNAIPESGGYRYMVGHIFSTRLHETYRESDKYNKFPEEEGYNWIHHGAIHAGVWNTLNARALHRTGVQALSLGKHSPDKPEIPDWLSEAPLPEGGTFSGMILNNFYGPTKKYFEDMMFPGNTPNNCMKMRMDRKDGTPTDIASEEHLQKLDAQNSMRAEYQYCLPGMHGAKFGLPLGLVDTYYATVADNVAFYRNLRASFRLGNTLLAPGEYHDLQEVEEGDHKRDRIQFLGDEQFGKERGRKGEVFRKGCKPFKGFDHFIPDISGPEYEKANEYVDKDEGEYFRSVHWRYVRGCPAGDAGEGAEACYYPGIMSGVNSVCGHRHSPRPGSPMPNYILK